MVDPNIPPSPEAKERYPIDTDFVPVAQTKLYDLAARFVFKAHNPEDEPGTVIGSFQTTSIVAADEIVTAMATVLKPDEQTPREYIFLEVGSGSAVLSDNIQRVKRRYNSPFYGQEVRMIATDAYVDLSEAPISRAIERRKLDPLVQIPDDLPRDTPIVICGNYFLDQLANDCVIRRDGVPYRVLIKASSDVDLDTIRTQEEFNALVRRGGIQVEKTYQELPAEEFASPIYADLPEGEEVLIPVGAYTMLKKWTDAGFKDICFFFKDYPDEGGKDRLYYPIALGFGLGVNFSRLNAACSSLGLQSQFIQDFFGVIVASRREVSYDTVDSITSHERDINEMVEVMMGMLNTQEKLANGQLPSNDQIEEWEILSSYWQKRYPAFREIQDNLSLIKIAIKQRG